MKEPPKKAEIPKPKAPAVTPVQVTPKIDNAPTLQFNIPVTTLAAAEIPGAVEAPPGPPTPSQGTGSGGGGGTGQGTGIGSGFGSGLGPGRGGGTGGGVYRGGGSGVTDPIQQQIFMLLLLMVTSKGIAGVPRASLEWWVKRSRGAPGGGRLYYIRSGRRERGCLCRRTV